MDKKKFTIDNLFVVQPDLGVVKSLTDGNEERLEPRLMQLLCILASHRGELVSREKLTLEVWDNYGNADEGLTQAISYLRKVLKDGDKHLIETVPKKGYVLNAVITSDTPDGKTRRIVLPKKSLKNGIVFTILLIVLTLTYWFFWRGNKLIPSDVLPTGKRNTSVTRNPVSPDVLPADKRDTNVIRNPAVRIDSSSDLKRN